MKQARLRKSFISYVKERKTLRSDLKKSERRWVDTGGVEQDVPGREERRGAELLGNGIYQNCVLVCRNIPQ